MTKPLGGHADAEEWFQQSSSYAFCSAGNVHISHSSTAAIVIAQFWAGIFFTALRGAEAAKEVEAYNLSILRLSLSFGVDISTRLLYTGGKRI
jgi:hypothetical protein